VSGAARSDFLALMATQSRERSLQAQRQRPASVLLKQIAALPAPTPLRLSSAGFDVIAELKLRSPALGGLRERSSVEIDARIDAYATAGAAAISVLTEPTRFDGALEDLARASAQLLRLPQPVPTMRKDFLVDEYQVLEARAAGAGGVLLIVRMLDDDVLCALIETALAQQLFVLLEIFDEKDIERAVRHLESQRRAASANEAPPGERLLVGVNSRDLVTLQVVPQRLEQLVAYLPTWLPRVAESGVQSPDDAARLAAAGYDLALVGGALMQAESPAALVAAMLQTARRHVQRVA
jgi:indole-3-glycerol phosphate synthase